MQNEDCALIKPDGKWNDYPCKDRFNYICKRKPREYNFLFIFSSCSYLKCSCKKWQKSRSSHRRCSVRKGVLRNFAKFTGKHPCQRLFFNRVGGLKPATLFKKRLWRRCFLVNFAKFLTIPFLQNTSGRLLLNQVSLEVNVKNIFERGAMHFSTETFFYPSYFAQITRSETTN